MKKFFKTYGLEYFIFVGPILLLFFIFFIYPFLQSVFYSFTNWNGVSYTEFKGLGNYKYIFTTDKDFWNSFKFTLLYTLATTVLINLSSIIVAKILTSGIYFEEKLRVAVFLPNILSLVVVGIIWNFIYGQLSNELFNITKLALFNLPWLTDGKVAVFSTAFAKSWVSLGWFTLIYVAGYKSIPLHLYEAAEIDGCMGLKKFFKITLPLLMPSITICLFTTITQGLQVFEIIYSLTAGGPGRSTETVVMNIYNTSFGSMFYGFGSAKTIVLSVVVMIVGFTQIYMTRKREVEL